RPSLCSAMERFVFHRSDINNPTHKIDLLALEYALRKHESQASGGDESRLFNLLEAALAEGIESLRTSPDVNLRDIASLMRLGVEELARARSDRAGPSGRPYAPDAAPLVHMALPHTTRAAKPSVNSNGAAQLKALTPAVARPAEDGAASSARDKLRQLKELLD